MNNLFFSASTRLVSGSRDNRVIFWDIQSCQNLKTIQIGRNLVSLFRMFLIKIHYIYARLRM